MMSVCLQNSYLIFTRKPSLPLYVSTHKTYPVSSYKIYFNSLPTPTFTKIEVGSRCVPKFPKKMPLHPFGFSPKFLKKTQVFSNSRTSRSGLEKPFMYTLDKSASCIERKVNNKLNIFGGGGGEGGMHSYRVLQIMKTNQLPTFKVGPTCRLFQKVKICFTSSSSSKKKG